MADLFQNKILCNKCEKVMKPCLISKNGFNLRCVKCEKCNNIIVHPADEKEYNDFIRLKNKDFEVKMRMVGNSYAVSIPREIVDFMREQEKIMNDMVRLSFDEANRVSLMFGQEEIEKEVRDSNGRVVKAREVRVMKNNKPVFHSRQISDSANPKNNRTIIKKEKDFEKENYDEEMEDEDN
jgi:hypothetical protein